MLVSAFHTERELSGFYACAGSKDEQEEDKDGTGRVTGEQVN